MDGAVFVGVDGGGTGEASSGCTNWNSVGDAAAFSNLKEAIEKALGNASIQKEQVRPLLELGYDAEIVICNDAEIACASGTDGVLQGVCIISGTGTITMGWNGGKNYRVAGWGPLLGDQGSGFDIGLSVLRQVTLAEDRTQDTAMKRKVLEELGLDNAQDLISWAYQGEKTEWARFAALSKIASTLALEGDKEALEIIDFAAQKLFESFDILYAKAGFSGAVDVVLSGGNFEHVQGENSLAGKLQQKILAKYPEARTGLPNMSASFAAAKLIMKDAKQ